MIDLQPDNPRAHYRLAGVLAPAALTERSAAAYRRCLELAPEHAGAWLGLGHMLKTLGKQQEGIDAYRRCLELEPEFGEAYFSLANLKTYRFEEAEIAEMQQRLESETVREPSRVNFLFALAKAYEDRKDYATAWRYYEEGNAKQRLLVSYDPVLTETVNDELVDFFNAEFFRDARGLRQPGPLTHIYSRHAPLGLDPGGADHRQPQPGGRHQRTALHRPPDQVPEPQSR